MQYQAGDDLGERMYMAFDEALKEYDWALLVGSDCPTMQVEDIHLALAEMAAGKDAVIGPATRRALNVPVETRIRQLEINLERARWVLDDLGDNFIVVNIAGFHAYLVRGREGVLTGRFAGIDDTGALILEQAGGARRHLGLGEVSAGGG